MLQNVLYQQQIGRVRQRRRRGEVFYQIVTVHMFEVQVPLLTIRVFMIQDYIRDAIVSNIIHVGHILEQKRGKRPISASYIDHIFAIVFLNEGFQK